MLTTAFPVMNYNDPSQLAGCLVKCLHAVGNNSWYVVAGSERLTKRLSK